MEKMAMGSVLDGKQSDLYVMSCSLTHPVDSKGNPESFQTWYTQSTWNVLTALLLYEIHVCLSRLS